MQWMAWTWPTAMFFGTIILMLIGMTIWQVVSPSVSRRGLLPMITNRGDRLFIGLLSSAYLHLLWLLILPQISLWGALILSVGLIVILLRWG